MLWHKNVHLACHSGLGFMNSAVSLSVSSDQLLMLVAADGWA